MIAAVKEISFSYGRAKTIDQVSFAFESGLFYGIIGTNGSGKTTLIDLICGLTPPDTGSVTLKGVPLQKISPRRRARIISLVPQNFYINFPYTVHEVVMMGRHPYMGRFSRLKAKDLSIIDSVMEETGINSFKYRKITELSGGERQRVLFARTLVQNTPLIVLDEATSNLDIRHALTLLNLVSKKVREENKTAISVFQDINLAALFCDVLLFIEKGRIRFKGKTKDILTAKTIEAIFHVNARIVEEPHAKKKQLFFQP